MSNIIKRDFHGIQIAFEGKEQVSLTDLWKASGSPSSKETWRWLNDASTADFLVTVANIVKPASVGGLTKRPYGREEIKELAVWANEVIKCVSVGGLLKTKRGKGGGTWAHWQIALSYAQYLSPELHMFVNQCFMERVQEEQNPELAFNRGRERSIKGWKREGKSDAWINERQKLILATKEDTSILAKHGDDSRVYAMCHNAMYKPIIGGTAKEYRQQNNLPEKAVIRDSLSDIELVQLQLASLVSKERIVEANIRGNAPCAQVHEVVAGRIHYAVTARGA